MDTSYRTADAELQLQELAATAALSSAALSHPLAADPTTATLTPAIPAAANADANHAEDEPGDYGHDHDHDHDQLTDARRNWSDDVTLKLVQIWRRVCQSYPRAGRVARMQMVYDEFQEAVDCSNRSRKAVEDKLYTVKQMYHFIVKVNDSFHKPQGARGSSELSADSLKPTWFELTKDERRVVRSLHRIRIPNISYDVFLVVNSVLNPSLPNAESPGASSMQSVRSVARPGMGFYQLSPNTCAGAGSDVFQTANRADSDMGDVVDNKRNWSNEVTLQLAKAWHSAVRSNRDLRGAVLSQRVYSEFMKVVGSSSRSRKAIEDKMHSMKEMYRFIRMYDGSAGASGQTVWFQLTKPERRHVRAMHKIRVPNLTTEVYAELDAFMNKTADSIEPIPEGISKLLAAQQNLSMASAADAATAATTATTATTASTATTATTATATAAAAAAAAVSPPAPSDTSSSVPTNSAAGPLNAALANTYDMLRRLADEENQLSPAPLDPVGAPRSFHQPPTQLSNGVRPTQPLVLSHGDEEFNSEPPAKRARPTTDHVNEQRLQELLLLQQRAMAERRHQHAEQMTLLLEIATHLRRQARAARRRGRMATTGPAASAAEATPFNRLVGEKDVLAAITSEYLDENAAKKDTSAATVCLGRVLMTTYRFQFLPDPHELELAQRHLLHRPLEEIESYFLIPLGCISSIKKKNSVIEVATKDLRQLSFRFDVVEVGKIHTVLTTYVFPNKIDYLFAFYHRLSASPLNEKELLPSAQDWFVYDPQVEWQREGVFDTGKWRVSYVNEGFREIETYPELIVVPSSVPDGILCDAAAFRSLGRIPSLAWYNKLNSATISRSSQPKVGVSKATSPADEALVAGISSSSLLNDSLHIIDCRPMSNALANRAKGYGVESSDNYKNCTVTFMNIPNIHSMRDSLKKLRALMLSTSNDNLQWLGNVEDTKWLVYIRQLLKSSLHVAQLIRDGQSVLLHCSHGWDRTSQISAIAQLLLDPFFRTWRGFQILIEKEWLSFGHPFQLRLSHGEKADTQESPIFIQFLDCVWQLVHLFPSFFEFNEGMLLMLAEALHSCRFGTFLLDCKKHRMDAVLNERTTSVWTWINGFRAELTEPTFKPNQHLNPSPSGLLRRVTLWEAMFMRWSAQPMLQAPEVTQDFFADHRRRIPTWQLPRVAWNALNKGMAIKMRDAEALRGLSARVDHLIIDNRRASLPN